MTKSRMAMEGRAFSSRIFSSACAREVRPRNCPLTQYRKSRVVPAEKFGFIVDGPGVLKQIHLGRELFGE